ncbi:unnamed protein product [Tilletia laevis]|nr:unnamed protein product [Tilletia laevis]
MPQLLQLLQLAARNGAQQTTPHTPAQPPRSDGKFEAIFAALGGDTDAPHPYHGAPPNSTPGLPAYCSNSSSTLPAPAQLLTSGLDLLLRCALVSLLVAFSFGPSFGPSSLVRLRRALIRLLVARSCGCPSRSRPAPRVVFTPHPNTTASEQSASLISTSSQVHTAQNTAPEHHRIRTARLSNQNQQPSPHCADYRTRTPPIRTARLSNQHQQPSPHCAEHRIRTPPHPNSASLYSTPAAAGVPGVPQHVDLVCSSAYVELQSSIDSTTSARCSASASPAPTPAFSSSALSTTSSTPFAWSWCAAKRFKPVFTVLGIAILMSLISSIMNSHAPRGLPMGISVDSTVKRAIGSSRQLARSRSRSASPTQSYEAVIVPSPDDSDFLDSEIDLPKSGQDGMDEKEDQMDDRAALPSVDTLASNSNAEGSAAMFDTLAGHTHPRQATSLISCGQAPARITVATKGLLLRST